MTVVHAYDLGSATLAVEAANCGLMDGFEHFLGERRLDRVSAPSFSISVLVGEPEAQPPEAEALYRGPLLREGECAFLRAGEVYFMAFPGEASMRVDRAAGRATIVVSPGHPRRAAGSMAALAIEFAHDHVGQQLVHAAGLALGEGRGMVLISAPSGTGKTTTALALARSGLAFAADDVLALSRGPAGIMARGLPRALNVHRRTAAMLSWLELGEHWNDNDEQPLPWRRLADAVALERGELPVERLVLLQRGDVSAIEPLAATDMLAALAADNVRGSLAGLTPLNRRRFVMLGELARTVPAWMLTLAEGLGGIGTIAEALKTWKG
jgi:hypothetical protein